MRQVILEDMSSTKDEQPFPKERIFPVGAAHNFPSTEVFFIVVLYKDATRLIKLGHTAYRNRVEESLKVNPERRIDRGDFVFTNYWHAYAYYQKICKWRRENGA